MPASRQDLIAANAVAGAAALIAVDAPPAAAGASQGSPPLAYDPPDADIICDLIVSGGTVVDPSRRLNGERDSA